MPARARKQARGADVPYTMRLPDGRTVFVLVPGRLTAVDRSGEVGFGPEAVRLLDRVRALAMKIPATPSPAFIAAVRDALGLTQTELAARLGVDKMTVARWEWGRSTPGPAAIRALDKLRKSAARRGVVIAA